jgi:hypothetical protein
VACGGATPQCSNGNCCANGWVYCGGACRDPQANADYCGVNDLCGGGSGTAGDCGANICSNGHCCPTGQIWCGNSCVDPEESNTYCGASGNCTGANDGNNCTTAGNQCSNSSCCPMNQVFCDGMCRNPTNNPDYCGVDSNCDGGSGTLSDGDCGAGTCVNSVCVPPP